jgi:hypothetical protein
MKGGRGTSSRHTIESGMKTPSLEVRLKPRSCPLSAAPLSRCPVWNPLHSCFFTPAKRHSLIYLLITLSPLTTPFPSLLDSFSSQHCLYRPPRSTRKRLHPPLPSVALQQQTERKQGLTKSWHHTLPLLLGGGTRGLDSTLTEYRVAERQQQVGASPPIRHNHLSLLDIFPPALITHSIPWHSVSVLDSSTDTSVLMKHTSWSSSAEQTGGVSPRTSSSSPRKRRRAAPTASTSSMKSSNSRATTCNDDKLASLPSSTSAPLQPKTDTEPIDELDCSVAAKSIFTRSFAPMLLYSSLQDNMTSTSITNRRCNNNTTTSCSLSFTTAPTQSLDRSCSNSTGAVNGATHSSSSSTTSQSSPSSTHADEDLDRDSALPLYTATRAECCSLPPLPTTVSCPHPALYPPPPRLPSLLSPPKLAKSYLEPYCPSLFGQGLPQLPKESKPALAYYSVDLHGSRRKVGKRITDRKQKTQASHPIHLPPFFTHLHLVPSQQHYLAEIPLSGFYKTEGNWPLTHSTADSIPTLTMARAVHGRKKPQAQHGAASHPQRRLSSRSLGDLPLGTNADSTGDVSLESRTDVFGGQDALSIPPFQCGNSGRPIRPSRLRVSRVSADLFYVALLTSALQQSNSRPSRRNTVTSFTSLNHGPPCSPIITAPLHTSNVQAKGVRQRTAVACDQCRNFK